MVFQSMGADEGTDTGRSPAADLDGGPAVDRGERGGGEGIT